MIPKRLPSVFAAFRRAKIDRHQRPHFDAVGRSPFSSRYPLMRPGDGGEQHVVDRAAERSAHRLDLRQRDGIGPGYALVAERHALEAGRRVVRHEKQICQFGRHPVALAKILGRPGWMRCDIERGLPKLRRRPAIRRRPTVPPVRMRRPTRSRTAFPCGRRACGLAIGASRRSSVSDNRTLTSAMPSAMA